MKKFTIKNHIIFFNFFIRIPNIIFSSATTSTSASSAPSYELDQSWLDNFSCKHLESIVNAMRLLEKTHNTKSNNDAKALRSLNALQLALKVLDEGLADKNISDLEQIESDGWHLAGLLDGFLDGYQIKPGSALSTPQALQFLTHVAKEEFNGGHKIDLARTATEKKIDEIEAVTKAAARNAFIASISAPRATTTSKAITAAAAATAASAQSNSKNDF